MRIHLLVLGAVLQVLSVNSLFAYAENGHRVIGALADQLLANKPAGDTVKKLLGNVSLERASTLPDELRGEDRARGSLSLPENPELEKELLAFRAANPPHQGDDYSHLPPSHHWFHYTDVPLQAANYAATKKGTFKWDIVQMTAFCTRVLAGKEKPDNDLKITPAVAVVLLSHFVGDIHQPLHVGALYMNKEGERLDPNTAADALESRGGNNIQFGASNLHAYWDFDSVESCLTYHRRLLSKRADEYLPVHFAQKLADKEPEWKIEPTVAPEAWAEQWANQILPLGREAHDRLKFLPQQEFDRSRSGKPTLRWTAIELPHVGKSSYSVFASKAVELEMNKAGWRLAALLEAALGSPSKEP
ncbi:MAG TPA: S1/P1 nuclease [Chthoniobacterales bacterium]|jgi:hypothetical protein